jgi:hypothetical protein
MLLTLLSLFRDSILELSLFSDSMLELLLLSDSSFFNDSMLELADILDLFKLNYNYFFNGTITCCKIGDTSLLFGFPAMSDSKL